MAQHVLITGGAGFIGSHLADELLRHGCRVRALDNLNPQVHPYGQRPDYLDPEVELVCGDVEDPDAVRRALQGIDVVYHLAAAVGVGQSMYAIDHYTRSNNLGTAVLLKALLEHPIERLVVASSMSIYGEGLYRDRSGALVATARRRRRDLEAGRWEPCTAAGEVLEPVPTPESKIPDISSVYALSKHDQERLCLIIGRAYGISTVALRFFNVYGSRQALSNPYTGVLAIFASRLLNGNPPLLFEDGEQRRDFVHVSDVVQALRLALTAPAGTHGVFNVGSGRSYSVKDVARRVAQALGVENPRLEITGEYRVGDIRHCFADIGLARRKLGYEPRVKLEAGLGELVAWLEGQVAYDHVLEARQELVSRGLTL